MATPTTDDILDDLDNAGDLTISEGQKADERITRRSGKDLYDLVAFIQTQAARGVAPLRTYARRVRD
jgi:hypothetical protein